MRTRLWMTTASLALALALTGLLAPHASAAPGCDATLVAQAAAEIAAACPCAGKTLPNGEIQPWKNHGGYVSCVTRARNDFAKRNDVSKSCVRSATRCAARSTCGKPYGFVVCRTLDACSDPAPGDDVAAGTCADAPETACDTAADCPVLKCSVKSTAEICEAQSGVAATGSCCE